MGSPCLFLHQQAFKMGYFYWLSIKNSNYLHAEFSLGYFSLPIQPSLIRSRYHVRKAKIDVCDSPPEIPY